MIQVNELRFEYDTQSRFMYQNMVCAENEHWLINGESGFKTAF
jgi:hypothetical protein